MSEVLYWAHKVPGLKANERLVLTALADFAPRGGGEVFPSIPTLVERTGLCRRSVFNQLDALEEKGLIKRISRSRENGSTASNGYEFPLVGVQEMHPGGAGDARGRVQEMHPSNVPLITTQDIKTPCLLTETSPKGEVDALFADIWKAYPKKVGKPAALRSFRTALKKSTLEDIAVGLARWMDHWAMNETEQRFIPNFATWLNQERWNDDTPKHSTGVRTFKQSMLEEKVKELAHDYLARFGG